MPWTKKSLEKIKKEKFGDYLLVVVSNAEPYMHEYSRDKIVATRCAGGIVTAFEPILKVKSGLWIGHGKGSADRDTVDEKGKVRMPPNSPQYDLKRIFISKKDLRGWYYGFSNEALWPLCHNVFERPVFYETDWKSYEKVNREFAEAVLEEVEGKKAIVWIQDYQLALVSKIIKEKRPDLVVGQFWHIPWPVPNIFKICPWRKEILEGLLGNELIGFQRVGFCKSFLASVAENLEAKVDFDAMTVTYNEKIASIRNFPISIDFRAVALASRKNKRFGKNYMRKIITPRYQFLSVGVDRLDYIKGLPERLKAIDRFLEKYPEYQEKFVHTNIISPSRTLIKRYDNLREEIEGLAENINFKYRTEKWQPICILETTLPPSKIYSLYKSADVMLVTSLADGMNLVAKEYVAAGPDDGALVLSDQAGAADELAEAVIVNPYDIEKLADGIKMALEMPPEEKKRRMEKMRAVVAEKNVYLWAGKFLGDLMELDDMKKTIKQL